MFHDIAHLMRLKIDSVLKPYGLTRLKWLAIGIIADSAGFSQADLANRLELKGAATGKLVDRLVERELVERRTDTSDRRVYRLFATQKSHALLLDLEPMGKTLRHDILRGLDKKEIKALKLSLTKIKENLIGLALAIMSSFAFKSEFILPMV